jgi:acid phosphatase family membrane protein YuiD
MRDMDRTSAELASFLTNPIFLSAFFSLFITQLIKAVISLFRAKAKSFRDVIATLLWKTGGMPSSHSALTVSIATAIGLIEGITSSVFVLSLFFCLVVIRDAMGVRRSAGLIARTLNLLGKELNEKQGVAFHPVKEVNGHTPTEVVVGSLLGFFIALAFTLL